MSSGTRVHKVQPHELERRRAEILKSSGLSETELRQKVESGGLVGAEWSIWSEIESIDFLLGRS